MVPPAGTSGETLIPKPNLARELGVSSRTLSRWLLDAALGFPRPLIIRGRLYLYRGAVEDWKIARLCAAGAKEATEF
jgi:hypothetical protein